MTGEGKRTKARVTVRKLAALVELDVGSGWVDA